MKIQFLGAVRTVTGSMHLLTGERFAHSCSTAGSFRGGARRALSATATCPSMPGPSTPWSCPTPTSTTRATSPRWSRMASRGNIYATPATRDLCSAMLRDAGHIQEYDAKYVNKKRAQAGAAAGGAALYRRRCHREPEELCQRGLWPAVAGRAGRDAHLPRRRPHPGLGHRRARHRGGWQAPAAWSSPATWAARTCPSSETRSRWRTPTI